MATKKFRGITLATKEWVYGDLLVTKDGTSLIHYYDEDGYQCSREVAPNSVGQYSEVNDKQGTEIYEGTAIVVNAEGLKADVFFEQGSFKTRLEKTNIVTDLSWWENNDLEVIN